jgi:hypothetical protein
MASDRNEDAPLEKLFGRLHQLMVNLVGDIDSVIEDNEELTVSKIKELRDHINYRLGRNEEIHDNRELLKVLNLLSEDKAVIEIIREDAQEWLDLLESIEASLKDRGVDLTSEQKKQMADIKRLTSEIKGLIRKD